MQFFSSSSTDGPTVGQVIGGALKVATSALDAAKAVLNTTGRAIQQTSAGIALATANTRQAQARW